MLKKIFLLLSILLTASIATTFAKDTDYNDQAVKIMQYSPVTKTLDNGLTITTINYSLGSGIFLQNGKILTAAHVIHFPDSPVEITLPNGKIIEGKIESNDPDTDYGIVVVTDAKGEKLPKGRPVLCKLPEVGDNVTWVGNPDGEMFVFSRGYVNKVIPKAFMMDARVIPGMSGAGVLNDKGEIVGVVVKTTFSPRNPGASFGIAVPVTVMDILCPPKSDVK